MANPESPQKAPYLVDLEAGKNYAFCTCGKSTNQPYCDGSHKGTDFAPNIFSVEESKTYALCGCKHSGTGQFCDGTHSKI